MENLKIVLCFCLLFSSPLFAKGKWGNRIMGIGSAKNAEQACNRAKKSAFKQIKTICRRRKGYGPVYRGGRSCLFPQKRQKKYKTVANYSMSYRCITKK